MRYAGIKGLPVDVEADYLGAYRTQYDNPPIPPGCKDICVTKYETRGFPRSGFLYLSGWKRCSVCEVMIHYDGKYCPCCHQTLANTPKNARHRRRFRLMKRVHSIIRL